MNKHKAILTHKSMIFLNSIDIWCSFNYIIFNNMNPEQHTKRLRGKHSTAWLHFIPKN